MTNVAWVVQHHMPLHILLQPMQVRQQQIMGNHEAMYFQHNCPKLFIVPDDRRPLLQVKQVGLVAQSMVKVAEFGFQILAETLPGTNPELCPILICH